MAKIIVQIAVSSAIYSIDKPYDYILPEGFVSLAQKGSRVIVPFGRGNKEADGFVVDIFKQEGGDTRRLKSVTHLYSDFPLNTEQQALARWIKARYFSTYFEAGAIQLPPGIWGKARGNSVSGIVRDKEIRMLSLSFPYEECVGLVGTGANGEKRKRVLDCFLDYAALPESELAYLTGISLTIIRSMVTKGLLHCKVETVYRRPEIAAGGKSQPIVLSKEQAAVYCGIAKGQGAGVSLIHGVTGSGKTEVYISLIQNVLKNGKTAIMLVPEIALTPQMVQRFYGHFGEDIAVMHSMLTGTQRYDEYKRVLAGVARVVIGTRSAIFAPLENLGIIIIDEEHEYSYKSEKAPKYNAIEVAMLRAYSANCTLVLGSATPSVESYYNAKIGKYKLYELENRFGNTPLPSVTISDMRQKNKGQDNGDISTLLFEEISNNLKTGEQSILFVNRRGNSGHIACVDCGYIPSCQHCAATLTYHSKNNRLMCHYCGCSEERWDICPQCQSTNVREIGLGTQKAEILLRERFPGIKAVRMDADTTNQRVSHQKLLQDFADKGQVLIGTQMVTKGLDFEGVTLVGVLDSDLSLYSSDYRGGARTFSLISQVVGRAGRRKTQGRAIIQTFSPEHPVIIAAAAQDYKSFYDYEIKIRKMLTLPPFCDIFMLTVSGTDDNQTISAALRLTATIKKAFDTKYSHIDSEILGPVAPAVYKINDRYRYNISFRGQDNKEVRSFVASLLVSFYQNLKNNKLMLTAEINPISY